MEDDDEQDDIYIDNIGGDFGIGNKQQEDEEIVDKIEKKEEGPVYFLSDSGDDEDQETGKYNQEDHQNKRQK